MQNVPLKKKGKRKGEQADKKRGRNGEKTRGRQVQKGGDSKAGRKERNFIW